jgi:hypothetical protein
MDTNLIDFKKLKINKLEKSFKENYSELIHSFSATELGYEIRGLIKEVRTIKKLKQSQIIQGKVLISELEKRSFKLSSSNQITDLKLEIEKFFT